MTRFGGNRLILHVGAPKCGSSSLQTALSQRPMFESGSGERFRYAVISNDCDIVMGDALRSRAASLACRHLVSANADHILAFGEPAIAGLAQNIDQLLRQSSVILSCESWIGGAEVFAGMHLLDRLAFDCEIVAYIRPQAEFLNASWWQWSAWTDGNFEEWLYFSGFGNTCAWAHFLQSWSSVDGVTSVSPRLVSNDIVGSFFESLGCDPLFGDRSNRSLPGVALRFLQRNRALRRDMHDSDIDFILERALRDWHEPAPWVLPIDYVAAFIEHCRPENERLLDMLTAPDRSAMLADKRWWDASCYQDRSVVAPGITAPDAEEIDAFAAALATALRTSERELAALRFEYRRLQPSQASEYPAQD